MVRLLMKSLSLFATSVGLILALAGCATNSDLSSAGGKTEPGDRERLGYPVSTNSCVVMATHFRWWPELSGYYLPAGTYKAEREDSNGVFFKAPDGFKLESLTARMDTQGGIYLPKPGSVGVRGHVYLWMSGLGWQSYLLPDQFFSSYGKTWKIVESNEQPNP
jgi:hypothetical protein